MSSRALAHLNFGNRFSSHLSIDDGRDRHGHLKVGWLVLGLVPLAILCVSSVSDAILILDGYSTLGLVQPSVGHQTGKLEDLK